MSENTETRTETIENARLDDVRPGDHLTWVWVREHEGATIVERREGIAHHRDPSGDWRTDRSGRLTRGGGEGITLTIRRPARELPTKFGAVIVPNDGCEYITATDGGVEYRAREAVLTRVKVWQGAWRSADGFLIAMHPGQIDPDTCKVADQ